VFETQQMFQAVTTTCVHQEQGYMFRL